MLINTNKIIKKIKYTICLLKECKIDYYTYTINLEFVKTNFIKNLY